MNISWYSPVDPESSEIARYSAQLLPYVGQYAGIATVADTDGGGPPAWWNPKGGEPAPEKGVAPLPIYHIGNNPVHLPIYLRSLEEPGLVVLHDLSLVDLARHLSHQLEQPGLWKEMMCRQYGDEVRSLVNRSENSVADYNEMLARYPLFQPFVAGALGVVVHSRYARDAVQRQLPPGIPLLQLNLPAAGPSHQVSGVARGAEHSGPMRFVFCGHVGPNRRLVQFMEAWGRLATPEAITLDLFGNISNNRELLQYAEHFGVADHIRLRGYVSDVELDEALHSADFAINLRWPTMGEASASQLRYWSAGLPTLVSDVGWYGELPNDAVCKVSVDNEIADLLAVLEDALVSPDKYRRVGQRGLQQLHSAHSAGHYARELVALAARLIDARLGYRMLDQHLVTIIASMCENDNDTRLFRDAIETAVATVQPQL
jgi:glycosyltransferase involved in cell wall biosynthesis